jgi:hypothetical protein
MPVLTAKINNDLFTRLKAHAEHYGMSISCAIRAAVAKFPPDGEITEFSDKTETVTVIMQTTEYNKVSHLRSEGHKSGDIISSILSAFFQWVDELRELVVTDKSEGRQNQ